MNGDTLKKRLWVLGGFACAAALSILPVYIVFASGFDVGSRSILGCLFVSLMLAVLAMVFFNGIIAFIGVPGRFYAAFVVFYYMMGIWGISTYRDYIDNVYWLCVMAFSIVCFILGGRIGDLLLRRGGVEAGDIVGGYKYNKLVAMVFIGASFLAALAVTVNHGILFFNPEARFAVSAKLSYFVEFSLPVTLTIFCYELSRTKLTLRLFVLPLFVLLMLLSLGYRNQPVLLIVGLVMSIFYCSNSRIDFGRFKVVFGGAVFAGLVFLGFSYLVRIENSVGRMLGWRDTISIFDVVLPELTLPFIPLHMAAREGMGVTTIALDRLEDIASYVDRFWFFLLDFSTILPDFSLTSGRVLGLVVNLNETSSLTPSLIGGLLISYGVLGAFLFFLMAGMGLSIVWGAYKRTHDPKYLSLTIVSLVYMVELTNRGIFKPMYIISVILVYLMSSSLRVRRE